MARGAFRRGLLARSIASVGLALALVFASALAPARAGLKRVTFALSSSSLATAAPRIAQELGLFAKHNLEAAFIIVDGPGAAMSELLSQNATVAIAGPGELIAARAAGKDVVAIATTYAGFGPSLVLSKAVAKRSGVSSGAPIQDRLRALDGLLIGAPRATSAASAAVKASAASEGANIRLTYLAPADMPAALEDGSVQGYIASAPYWAAAVTKGVGVLWVSGPKNELSPAFTPSISSQAQVMRDYADANPDVVKALTDVMTDLRDAIALRPDDVKAAVASAFPEFHQKTLDLVFVAESMAWSGRQLTPKQMEREISVVKAAGTQVPGIETLDPADMLYPKQ